MLCFTNSAAALPIHTTTSQMTGKHASIRPVSSMPPPPPPGPSCPCSCHVRPNQRHHPHHDDDRVPPTCGALLPPLPHLPHALCAASHPHGTRPTSPRTYGIFQRSAPERGLSANRVHGSGGGVHSTQAPCKAAPARRHTVGGYRQIRTDPIWY